MEFSRQEDQSGLLCPPPGNLPDPGIEPGSPALQADSLPTEPPGKLYGVPVGKKNTKDPCPESEYFSKGRYILNNTHNT